MNKIIFYFCLAFFFCTLQQTESRPLNLGKAAKKLLKILGTGTYYNVSAGYNSCGSLRSDDELVVAVNRPQMENGTCKTFGLSQPKTISKHIVL